MSCCHMTQKNNNTQKNTNDNAATMLTDVWNAASNKLCYLCGSTKHASSDCPLYA